MSFQLGDFLRKKKEKLLSGSFPSTASQPGSKSSPEPASDDSINAALRWVESLLYDEHRISFRFRGLAKLQTYPWLKKLNESDDRLDALKGIERQLKRALRFRKTSK